MCSILTAFANPSTRCKPLCCVYSASSPTYRNDCFRYILIRLYDYVIFGDGKKNAHIIQSVVAPRAMIPLVPKVARETKLTISFTYAQVLYMPLLLRFTSARKPL